MKGAAHVTFDHTRSAEHYEELKVAFALWWKEQSRVGDVEITWDDLPGDVKLGLLFKLLWGLIEAGPNGLSVISTIRPADGVGDPAEFRLASNSPEPTLAHWSWNHLRPDGNQIQLGMFLGKRWEAMRRLGAANLFGELGIFLLNPALPGNEDQQMQRQQSWEPDGIHLWAPVHLHGPLYDHRTAAGVAGAKALTGDVVRQAKAISPKALMARARPPRAVRAVRAPIVDCAKNMKARAKTKTRRMKARKVRKAPL